MKPGKFLIALTFALIIFPVFINAQDLALNKTYTLSAPPNYQYTASPSDKTSLTDGIYTNGYFWSQRTTVGWDHKPVTITIDLGGIQPISAVTFNTVRFDKQLVNYPKNIFIFISTDNKKFRYVGDAADTSYNTPGSYLVKKFSLNNIDASSRYVTLSVVPNGIFLFCDEIEVLKSNTTALQDVELIPKDQLKHAEDSLKNIQFSRKNLAKSVGRLQQISTEKTGASNSMYLYIQKQLTNKTVTESELINLKNKTGAEHADNMRTKYKSAYLLSTHNPWDTLAEFYEPAENFTSLPYNYRTPVKGVQYGSFTLTNCSDSPQTFLFKISNSNPSVAGITLFDVPYVPSLNDDKIPDPMVPVKGSIRIEAGVTEMFIFSVIGLKSGTSLIGITTDSKNRKVSVNITAEVFNLPGSGDLQNLNANVWAYLNYPMIKDRQESAAKDLAEHHVNTIVIPPAILPGMQTTDYTVFANYISGIRDVKNILLFMNYSSLRLTNNKANALFLSAEWKRKFNDWYNKIIGYMRENGFLNSQIFLYPYDEVSGKDVSDFRSLVTWAKEHIPGIKFYATLANGAAIDTLLPLIDAAQIQSTYTGLKNLPPHKCDIWIYSGSGPSRVLSPYIFYRLMAWQAFESDYKGIGFWNYADEGADKQLNLISDPLTNPASSYSVIYDGPGKEIISSRRWEAFRLGIEDYAILNSFANKFGINKARELATEALTHPDDLNRADSIRNEMINELTKVK